MMSVATVAPALLLGWHRDTVILVSVMSVSAGLFHFGWASWVRFSHDEWVMSGERAAMIARIQELEGLTGLPARNRELADRNRTLEAKLRERRPAVRETEAPEPVQPKRVLPRNVESALVIHREWLLDPSPDHSGVSRSKLMQLGNLTRAEVELGWDLLRGLKFADKAGQADNAKWVIVDEDADALSEAIGNYLALAPAGSVAPY